MRFFFTLRDIFHNFLVLGKWLAISADWEIERYTYLSLGWGTPVHMLVGGISLGAVADLVSVRVSFAVYLVLLLGSTLNT